MVFMYYVKFQVWVVLVEIEIELLTLNVNGVFITRGCIACLYFCCIVLFVVQL